MRWLTALVVLGIVVVSGTVMADVILAYTVNNGVGPNTTGPFYFVAGNNYATANAAGVVVNTYAGGGANGPSVTTTLSGILTVPVEAINVTFFETASVLGSAAAVNNATVPSPTVLAPAGVVCAYAFISDDKQSYGATLTGTAACGATTPNQGALSAGCSTGKAGLLVVNLLTGVVSGTTWTCVVPSGTAANTQVLYISYAITTNAAVSATALNTFTIPVTLP